MTVFKLKRVSFYVGCLLLMTACGGPQKQETTLDIRPLEESKAFEIIEESLGERGYLSSKGGQIELANKVRFSCDFIVNEATIAIEFLTQQDRLDIGEIPRAASGSRLHVIAARAISSDPSLPGKPIYVLLVDDRKFVHQYNPTSELRANVTFLEIDSRLRRDLADFLSWYEANGKKR